MDISYFNQKVNKQFISINKTKKEPNVIFDQSIGNLYVFMMHDPDENYLNWLVVNNKTIISYVKPSPSANQTHHYVYSLFNGNITYSILQNSSRVNFNFDEFTKNLELITQNYFTTQI